MGDTAKKTPRVFEAEAARLADALLGMGMAGDRPPNAGDLGVVASSVCGLMGLPFSLALGLARRMEPFFRGRGVDRRTLFRMCLFLKSNEGDLRAGLVPPGPDEAPLAKGVWGVVQCVAANPAKALRTGRLWAVGFLLMSGRLAGTEFETAMPGGFISGTLRIISRAGHDKEACHPSYLYGMRMLVTIGKGARGGVVIKGIDPRPSLANRNARLRTTRAACAAGPCWRCPKGTEDCPHAVKRFTTSNN